MLPMTSALTERDTRTQTCRELLCEKEAEVGDAARSQGTPRAQGFSDEASRCCDPEPSPQDGGG